MSNSFWLCHPGDYEIYHVNEANMRREHRGVPIACIWKICVPNASVRFVKEIDTKADGYAIAYVTGSGCIEVDGKAYPCGKRVKIPAGKHYIQVNSTNPGGLCSAFVESDVCPSDSTWKSNYFAGHWLDVWCKE